MKIARERPKRELVNITPLIDVVFILLVFFMLAGAIEPPDPVEVETPVSDAMELLDEEDPKELTIIIDADGNLFVDEEPVNDPRLRQQVSRTLAIQPDTLLQIKADANTEAARVIAVMEDLREAGAEFVVLITVGGPAQSVGG